MKTIIAIFLICFSLVALIFMKAVAKQEIADIARWIQNVREWHRQRRERRLAPAFAEHRNAKKFRRSPDGKKEYEDEFSSPLTNGGRNTFI